MRGEHDTGWYMVKALHLGSRHLRSTKSVSNDAHHGRGRNPCPLCDEKDLEMSVVDNICAPPGTTVYSFVYFELFQRQRNSIIDYAIRKASLMFHNHVKTPVYVNYNKNLVHDVMLITNQAI